ncbi:MAG: hypothetical protein ACJAZO_003930 [Myxococcota bacterium]|jgi:hypothetical protein
MTVVIEDNNRGDVSVEEAATFKDGLDLSYTVLADVDGDWFNAWGETRHSYTVIDSNGFIVFHELRNSGSLVDDLVNAALAAE